MKTIKLKKGKAAPVAPTPKEVDRMAEEYAETEAVVKRSVARLDQSKKTIKRLAAEFGDAEVAKDKKLLVGRKWVAGYQEQSRSGGLDLELIRTKHPAIWKQCLSPMFDERKLADMLKRKLITRKAFLSFCKPDTRVERICVELKHKAKGEDADSRYEN